MTEVRETGVDVWLLKEGGVTAERILQLAAILSDEELERAARRRSNLHRNQFLVSHTFLRLVLSRYAPVAPEAWSFHRVAGGRPEVKVQDGSRSLYFSLSHTDGLCAVGVSEIREVGVDVEELRVCVDERELAADVLSQSELAAARHLDEAAFRFRFLELWTLKEAYLKARGIGLTVDLREISFEVNASGAVLFGPAHGSAMVEAASWTFALDQPTPNHTLAVAVRGTAAPINRHWFEMEQI